MTSTTAKMYRQWRDNFLTTKRFAEHYEIPLFAAELLIAVGRKDHNALREVEITIQDGKITTNKG